MNIKSDWQRVSNFRFAGEGCERSYLAGELFHRKKLWSKSPVHCRTLTGGGNNFRNCLTKAPPMPIIIIEFNDGYWIRVDTAPLFLVCVKQFCGGSGMLASEKFDY